MKIWKVRHSEENEDWVEVKGGTFQFNIDVLNDMPRKSEWDRLELQGIDGTHAPLHFDSPVFTSRSLIVTERAKECLEDLLDDNIELLPARLEDEPLWLLHVMSTEGCVNHEESVVARRKTGKVRGFREYQFNEEVVAPLTLFGIPEERVYCPFCTEVFKTRVEECGLRGLEFKLVWDSELPKGSIVFPTICV
ncbi:DUF1629 domain-containing protein [Adlercreutzia sp. R25]|uniref:DUF1629 domain-containing protein n=1 Tax=Adlercreutzia shanghongiae TaxID=3111773 RepID=A0ABU6IZB8_9ACTN|nr:MULTISPECIES: DUF1629 domain-containing protein [unclassified Adlercreutzia]MEC4272975.1 DUF1629 domain-containing protein [Adlercreutzia sp. R25]MEC4295234.1 DUF1629 domain-containing protein [Adlercreutzia sp. R22]